MSIEELSRGAIGLENRYKGINGWIKNNINTAPNFREMVDCIIEYGKLLARCDKCFEENGYPFLEERGRAATHYEIPAVMPEVGRAQKELHEMLKLRGGHEFFKDEVAKNFMQELTYRAEIAGYNIPGNRIVDAAKKDALCIAAGVYFYIWETKQREPWYQYDNVNEWNDLNEKYALYKEAVGVQETVDRDGHIYQGPQFGEVLETMLVAIERNYAFRKEITDTVEDSVGAHK